MFTQSILRWPTIGIPSQDATAKKNTSQSNSLMKQNEIWRTTLPAIHGGGRYGLRLAVADGSKTGEGEFIKERFDGLGGQEPGTAKRVNLFSRSGSLVASSRNLGN